MSDLAPAVHAVAAPATSPPAAPAATRPREKLRQRGLAALTDADLLALVLGSGTTGRSAWRIARSICPPPGSGAVAWWASQLQPLPARRA